MQTTAAATSLSGLETAVLETVVYSDVFDFPVTRNEIWRWLPIKARLGEVEEVLNGSRLMPDLLTEVSSYVTLKGREHLVSVREQRRKSSAVLRDTAERYARLISRLPFVRLIAITGSIAAENADKNSDLDYLLVTAPGRVWLTRSMTVLIVRLASMQGVTLCPNYLLSESAVALQERDLYTARELFSMIPVGGTPVYAKMMIENVWWHEYLPNAPKPFLREISQGVSPIRRLAEAFLHTKPFDWLEAWLLSHKGAELRRQAGNETTFDETMCKGHFDAWGERTREKIAERMRYLIGAN